MDAKADIAAPVRRVSEVGTKGGEVSAETDAEIKRARGGGVPLDRSTRTAMEQGFGADFGAVRVHTGPEAANLNERVQAKAFTVGNDVFFRDALPDATTRDGQELLAHELTHTLQQGAGRDLGASRVVQRHMGPSIALPSSKVTGTGQKSVTAAKRQKAVEGLLVDSAIGKKALKIANDNAVVIDWQFAGAGSTFNGSANTVNLNKDLGDEDSALVYVHEMNHAGAFHAGLTPDVMALDRDTYVNTLLAEETEGTVQAIEAKHEIEKSSGGIFRKPKKMKATFASEDLFWKKYNEAKEAQPKGASTEKKNAAARKAGWDAIRAAFGDGTIITSNTLQPYTEYYGDFWDQCHPPPPPVVVPTTTPDLAPVTT